MQPFAVLPVSIRSPHRSKGRCLTQSMMIVSFHCFNPLPSPKQGEIDIGPAQPQSLRVSIRSPHRSKGRLIWPAITASRCAFQSAPLTEARGDSCSACEWCRAQRFNPLPSPKQGEILLGHAAPVLPCPRFNPLPSPKQGEISACTISNRTLISCFNPLPSPKQGEIHPRDTLRRAKTGFNPLPSPKQGEMRDCRLRTIG